MHLQAKSSLPYDFFMGFYRQRTKTPYLQDPPPVLAAPVLAVLTCLALAPDPKGDCANPN